MSETPSKAWQRYTDSGLIAADLSEPPALAAVCGGQPIGTLMEKGSAPPGILLVYNFVNKPTCASFVEYAAKQPGKAATISRIVDGERKEREVSPGRVVSSVSSHGIAEKLFPILVAAYRQHIEPHYGVEIEWMELPSLLRYEPGGRYDQHADSDNWIPAKASWQRIADRDFSILLYLNDEYTGGELEFLNFDYRIRPKTGLLVCFPSDHRFIHRALPVETGKRYAVASWAARKGSDRVSGEPPPGAVLMAAELSHDA